MLIWGQKTSNKLMRARLRRWQCQREVVEAGDWEAGSHPMFCSDCPASKTTVQLFLGETHDFLWFLPFGVEKAANLSQKMFIHWFLSQQAPHASGSRSHGSLEMYLCMVEKKSEQNKCPPPGRQEVWSASSEHRRGEKHDEGSLAFTNEQAQKLLI